MHWKVFLGYSKHFWISRNAFQVCYRIIIRPVTLAELETFRNYKGGFSIIFPKMLDETERFTKVRIFFLFSRCFFL